MSKNFTFSLTEQEADLVVKSLGELPYKITAGLIGKLQKQFQEQGVVNQASAPAIMEERTEKN